MLRVNRVCIMFVIAALILSACQLPPHPRTGEGRILFVGDSFTFWNMGIDAHIKRMTASAVPPLTIETASVTIAGASLKQLWNQSNAADTIRSGDWDVVVLQDYLATATDEQEFYEYARKFDQEIRRVNAQTVLYMPWQDRYSFIKDDSGVTTEAIVAAYDKIGGDLGVRVAPVGIAWERSYTERPDLRLLDSDSVHPNVQGTYLTICVLYATIFEQSPVGLVYRPADLIPDPATAQNDMQSDMQRLREQYQITDDEAAFLQRIAWETVQEYQAR